MLPDVLPGRGAMEPVGEPAALSGTVSGDTVGALFPVERAATDAFAR